MKVSRSRRAAGLAATSLAAAAVFAGGVVLTASPAQARCAGVGNPVPASTYVVNGIVKVKDVAKPGTCDGDNQYRFTLIDAHHDGVSVSMKARDGNLGWRTIAQTSSETGQDFIYNDVNNTSNFHEQLCFGSNCGWGTTAGGYGTNYGF